MKIVRRVLLLVALTLCIASIGCDEDESALPFAGYAWLPVSSGFSPAPVGSGSILIIPTAATSTAAGGGGR